VRPTVLELLLIMLKMCVRRKDEIIMGELFYNNTVLLIPNSFFISPLFKLASRSLWSIHKSNKRQKIISDQT